MASSNRSSREVYIGLLRGWSFPRAKGDWSVFPAQGLVSVVGQEQRWL